MGPGGMCDGGQKQPKQQNGPCAESSFRRHAGGKAGRGAAPQGSTMFSHSPFKVRLMLLSMLCDMVNNKPQQDKPSDK